MWGPIVVVVLIVVRVIITGVRAPQTDDKELVPISEPPRLVFVTRGAAEGACFDIYARRYWGAGGDPLQRPGWVGADGAHLIWDVTEGVVTGLACAVVLPFNREPVSDAPGSLCGNHGWKLRKELMAQGIRFQPGCEKGDRAVREAAQLRDIQTCVKGNAGAASADAVARACTKSVDDQWFRRGGDDAVADQ